jgi:hypothetical protein
MSVRRSLPWIVIGVGLVVAGLVVWTSPTLIGALEMLSAGRAEQHSHTIFFIPGNTSRASAIAAFAGVALAVIGAAILIVRIAVRMRR